MPLVVAPVGKDVRVVKILADEKTKKHLENLGITIDSVIRVISASGGSVICVVTHRKPPFFYDFIVTDYLNFVNICPVFLFKKNG